MIIAHFFLRIVDKEPHIYVETTSSTGLEQPSPAAQDLLKVSYDERRQDWVKKAYYEFVKRFPNLVLIDAMENTLRLESSHPSFDLVFRPKDLGYNLCADLKKSDKPVLSVIKNLFSQNKNGE